MGNEILLTAEERGIVKGIEQGIEQGSFSMALENIKNAMNSFGLNFDEICDKLNISEREKYREFV